MTKNKGYTLIEALIVIAIMAILGGLSMFSIGVIRDAKRSAAVTTFDSQISSCLVKTKAVSEVSGEKVVCMYIYKRPAANGKCNYCIKVGYNTTSGIEDITKGTIVDVNDDSTWDAVLPKDVALLTVDGAKFDEKKIIFNKSDGSVKEGNGRYAFYDAGGKIYATIWLDKTTGKHHIIY